MTTITTLSLGAGVQSTTMALLACEGTLPKPDAAIFADTGWEPRAVYEHLDRLEKVLTDADIPLFRVSRGGSIRDDVLNRHIFATIPVQVLKPDGSAGKVLRQCTGKYKIEPVERKIRELLGASVREIECKYCKGSGQRIAPWDTDAGLGACSVCRGRGARRLVGPVPRGATAEQWIGFSTDEIHRVSTNGFPSYSTPAYPLLDLGMSRKDCTRWLTTRGWSVAKSACIGCPYHGNRHWREMRDQNPTEWADAVEFDRAIRHTSGMAGEKYLHISMRPLDQAPIDRVMRGEWAERQTNLFDAIADIEAGVDEDGDPDGCSPYGCRSGVADGVVDLGMPRGVA